MDKHLTLWEGAGEGVNTYSLVFFKVKEPGLANVVLTC